VQPKVQNLGTHVPNLQQQAGTYSCSSTKAWLQCL